MTVLKETAPAKVNFALDIAGRREDGYHEMRMINHTIDLADVLTFTTDADLRLTCDDAQVPLGEENLILRTAVKMQAAFHVAAGAVIHLEKKIPMQAGLGGGSADAAATIRGLNRLWELHLSTEAMRDFGAEIGADVPYCISGGTALVEGFGERITFLKPLPTLPVLILKPAINISTPEAFRMADDWRDLFHPQVAESAACLNRGVLNESIQFAGNSFEGPVFERWPLIGKLKEKCSELGALYTTMSGSGSTVAAYFDDLNTAEAAADQLKHDHLYTFLSVIQGNG